MTDAGSSDLMAQEPPVRPQVESVEGLVRVAVEQYRSKLLDLSSRNPLVNFRHSERSRNHIRVVDEIPEILFSKLESGRELTFDPVSDPVFVPDDELTPIFETALRKAKRNDEDYLDDLAKLGTNASERQKKKLDRNLRDKVRQELGFDPFSPTTDPQARAREIGIKSDYDLPRNNGQTARHFRDLKLQTLFFRDNLDSKLGTLRDSARVLLNDAGVNALYCAFGFLEYYESTTSDEKRVAPLVFYPIELDRTLHDGEYRYFIRPINGDIEVNVALAELLRQQMAIELPQWRESETEASSLELFFSTVEKVIAARPEWKLRRYVTIGLFTFSTLVMYKDLEPLIWSTKGAPLEQHDLLRTLVAGAETRGGRFADDYNVDEIKETDVLLVTDADSSQHSAVIDVIKGKNSVIQGPPGTGKSQTITNIIAAALYAGKSVLFVAEKMAALEVVAKRLKAAGLEQFCLELHSTKTTKTALVASLSSRLEYVAPVPSSHRIQSNLDALDRAKRDLIYYVEKTNMAAGQTGLTIHEVLVGSAKREALRHQLPATLANARLANAINLTEHQRAEMRASGATLNREVAMFTIYGGLKGHPWRGFQNAEITDFDSDELLTRLRNWTGSLESAVKTTHEVASQIGDCFPEDINNLHSLCASIAALPLPAENVVSNLLTLLNVGGMHKGTTDLIALVETIIETESHLRKCTRVPDSMIQIGSARFAEILGRSATAQIAPSSTLQTLHETLSQVQEVRRKLGQAEQAAKRLVDSFKITSDSFSALRAAVLGAESLHEISGNHRLRSDAVIDERNGAALQAASDRCATLINRRTTLEAKIDLAALPAPADLTRYSFSLKTTNPLLAPFVRDCREAKKTYIFASHEVTGKISRDAIADALKQSAQFLIDEQQFLSDQSIRLLCGQNYDGLRTPLSRLVEVNTWAARLKRSMSIFDEIGDQIKAVLLTGKTEELDSLAIQTEGADYIALQSVLRTYSDARFTSLSNVQEYEQNREAILRDLIALFLKAEILPDSYLADIESAVPLIKRIEDDSATIKLLVKPLKDVLPEAPEQLKARLGDLRSTHLYADVLIQFQGSMKLRNWLFSSVENIKRSKDMFGSIAKCVATVEEAYSGFNSMAVLDTQLWCGQTDINKAPLVLLIERCARALDDPSSLRSYISFLLTEDFACDAGLGPVLKAYLDADSDYSELEVATDLVFYRSAAEQILNDDLKLKRHSGATHEQLRKQYQQLDREYLLLRRSLLCSQLSQKTIPEGNYIGKVAELTELALVQHIVGQTRPRIAIRELFRRAGGAVKALKPCWMMSPMSVAQFLHPGMSAFDLIVMDEASQIRPEEALGAIIRGKQLVIVGDQMQLPPTSFFQKLSADRNADSDDEEMVDVKQESVLEAAAARFYPVRRLKWHYRSEHGSLIAFSNREFYDDNLTVFPSPHHDDPRYGVKLVEVPGLYNAGTNEPEVQAIVSAALDFMLNHSDQSLGLVAVNSKQAELIRERMDHAFAENLHAEAYRTKWEIGLESFFVKNLENVQGDERDAIFISTVYGPDSNGNFYQRFGPINSEYGHRRLNVLFTRAKRKVVLFTSMKPEGIQDEGKKWGVRALKGYIQFARDGHSTLPELADRECDSEFERWVMESLRAEGFESVPQLGFAGYRLDIAVRHPRNPGIFLCGIECDGATYHTARSVRERDRLRQEILERLGWKIYRIWSTDWFRNSKLEMDKLLNYLRVLAEENRQGGSR